jgi:pyruvate-formate lyase-activating enzyme
LQKDSNILRFSSGCCLLNNFYSFLISEIEKFKVSYLDYYKYFSNYLDILRAKVEIAILVIKSYNTSDVIIERISDFISSEVQNYMSYEYFLDFVNYGFNSDACSFYVVCR